MHLRIVALALLAATSACSPAGEPEIAVESAWARPTLKEGATSAAYLSIANGGKGDDRLLAASSAVAGKVSLHSSSSEGGISRMRPIKDGVTIPAGQTIRFEPGGNHLMLERLKRRLADGDKIPVTLQFERSGPREVQVTVGQVLADDVSGIHEGH